MSAFQIFKEGLGMIEREIVHDCDSVEAYVARKFGSVDPAVAGITVVMEGADVTTQPAAGVLDVSKVEGNAFTVVIPADMPIAPPAAPEPVIEVTPVFGVMPTTYIAGPDAPEGTFTAKSPEDLLKADIAVDTAILAAEQAAHPVGPTGVDGGSTLPDHPAA